MSRLNVEFDRLFAPLPAEGPKADGSSPDLIGPQGQVRALVLDVGRPVDWERVGVLWRALQDDLALPAPAIAISGTDSFQLWFSLAEALPAAQAHGWLEALRRRYLSELPATRVRVFPQPDGEHAGRFKHAARVPVAVAADQWSAFVAPGLAPVFAEAPWLDFPPSNEGQADLLRGLASLSPEMWADARARLQAGAAEVSLVATVLEEGRGALPTISAGPESPALLPAPALPAGAVLDPRHFLLQVMNDERVALPLRIDAAKALLPYTVERPPATPGD